jgi:hypothetical protein
MTNRDKFVETFGNGAFNEIAKKADRETLLWFLAPYVEIHSPAPVKKYQIHKEDPSVPAWVVPSTIKSAKKPKRTKREDVLKRYINTVEDFYLSGEKTKSITVKDDGNTCTYGTLEKRFKRAIKVLKLDDCVVTHKYYQNTVNEAVVLENVSVAKCPVTTYKCL